MAPPGPVGSHTPAYSPDHKKFLKRLITTPTLWRVKTPYASTTTTSGLQARAAHNVTVTNLARRSRLLQTPSTRNTASARPNAGYVSSTLACHCALAEAQRVGRTATRHSVQAQTLVKGGLRNYHAPDAQGWLEAPRVDTHGLTFHGPIHAGASPVLVPRT